jgi:hypothetical protein
MKSKKPVYTSPPHQVHKIAKDFLRANKSLIWKLGDYSEQENPSSRSLAASLGLELLPP